MRRFSFVLFLILMISNLTLRVQLHFSDTESFLNRISKTDKNHDYDKDGKTETTKQSGNIAHLGSVVLFKEEFKSPVHFIPSYFSEVVFLDPKLAFSTPYVLALIRPPIV